MSDADTFLSRRNPPEPWSPLARKDQALGQQALERLAESKARRQLVREFERYVRGEVSGRALLVAGHRGAGKTTAVLAAMQEVYDRCGRSPSTSPLSRKRPLLVRLHAPSFLLPPINSDESEASGPPTAAQQHSKRFLQEMAAGLFPVLLDEIRRLLVRISPSGSGLDAALLQEMTAQLVDELARGVTLGELREFYRMLDKLPFGLLRNSSAFEELTAINAAAEAYLVVTGKLETKQGGDRSVDERTKTETGFKLDGQGLVKALTPVSAAMAAAVGLANDSPITALFVSGAIVLGGMGMTSTRVRERKRAGNSSRSFIRDNTHESLIRRVPLVVDMLRAAGFPAVFVVDELDKVDNPAELLEGVLGTLKSYVTERSLFCFLVDREYYAQIHGATDGVAVSRRYSVEHTFYTDSIYVVSSPADLHAYLRRTLDEDQGTEGDDPKLRPARGLGFVFMRLALLHQSRMHPYDLRRALSRAIDNQEFDALLRPDGVLLRTRERKYEAFFQLCIEWLLTEKLQRRQISGDPYYAQKLYDLLYGVSAAWKRGERLLPEDKEITGVVDEVVAAAAQRVLLERALRQLLEYLRTPSQLLHDIDAELDAERLFEFLAAGEQEPSTDELRTAMESIQGDLRGRDERLMSHALASPKYLLVRNLDRERLHGIVEGDSYVPVVNPRGYTEQGPSIDEEHQLRIGALSTLRGEASVKAIGFAALWNAAMPGLALSQFDRAYSEVQNQRDGADQAYRDVVRSVAEAAPDAARAILVLTVGTELVARLCGGETNEDRLDQLLRYVHGTTTEQRAKSAAMVVRRAAEFASIELSTTAQQILDQQPIDLSNLADALELGSPTISDALRPKWQRSFCWRIAQRLDHASAEREGAAALDLIADTSGWFPRTLRVWHTWSEPIEWTVTVWSDLFQEVGDDWPGLALVAAARLQYPQWLRGELQRHERADRIDDPLLLAWTRRRLDAMSERRIPVVVLVNPGRVMSRWRPVPGVSARVVEVRELDASFVRDFQTVTVVLSELDVLRPPGLRVDQYVVVRDRGDDAHQGGETLEDGTPVLYGPTSLSAALSEHLSRMRP